jgi:hypothetical protein
MTETEFSPAVARALEDYAPPALRSGQWEDVLRRARPPRRKPLFLLAAAVAVLVGLAFGTPLGSAIRDTFAGFSAWLEGTPGTPASPDEQRAFEQASGSWVEFPGSPQLRRLIQTHVDGVNYALFGFRSGDSLCIRVVASGAAQGSTIECAPVADLENDDAPVRVLLADWGVGRGDKTKTVGFDTLRAPLAQVTAGIAADGVSSVELTDDLGSHRVEPSSNSFLYVAPRPDVGQLVTKVHAELAAGGSVDVPFNPALRAPNPAIGNPSGVPGGPTHVDRVLPGGTIGWLDRREERGEPLSSLSHHLAGLPKPEFGRVVTPDPAGAFRVAVWITADNGVCSAVIERAGASGGCIGALGHLFEPIARPGARARPPFTGGYSVAGAGAQYAIFGGLASDDVARLAIFTSTGNTIPVALHDNAYLASVALARMPAKLVAYDADERVVGIEDEGGDNEPPATPVGEPILQLSATAGESSLELRAVRTKEGGQCWFARYKTGESGSCVGPDWANAPLRVGWSENPPLFVYGRAREDIRTITLRYADGDSEQIEPGQYGYVLYTIPPEHRDKAHELVELIGRGADGEVVARLGAR